jgi:diphthine-ammonia ligase
VQPQLHALRRKYGINVCGEGGEYETLTLDCPLFRFGRIVLDEWQPVVLTPDNMAPVALLHPTAFHVEAKPPSSGQDGLSESNAEVFEVPDNCVAQPPPLPPPPPPPAQSGAVHAAPEVGLRAARGGSYLSLAAEVAGCAADFDSAEATAAALGAALQRINDELPAAGVSWGDALFVHLYVPAMAHFAAANAAYARFLPATNPPARATVQLAPNPLTAMVVEVLLARCARWEGGLPGVRTSSSSVEAKRLTCFDAISATARRPGTGTRHVLHVQSISEWAPSCIGPYSQALAHLGIVHFAGQIPLDPAAMAIAPGSTPLEQSVRSVASCAAVAVAMRTDLARSMLWCTVYCADVAGPPGRAAAEQVLQQYLCGELGSAAGAESSDSGGEEEALDDYLVPPPMCRHWEPLVTYVSVPELPRG